MMSDFTEGSHKRDRHRRHRGGGGNKAAGDNRAAKGTALPGESRTAKPSNGRNDGTRDARHAGVGEGRRNGEARREGEGRRAGEGRRSAESRRDRYEDLPPLPKLPTPTCPRCGQPIQDITSALADRDSGEAVHFDCVLAFLQGAENLSASEKLVYIGHGRFAVMTFENPSDTKKFKIVRTIEWENRDTKAEWRDDISGRFSQVK
jgi:hypothetical protein